MVVKTTRVTIETESVVAIYTGITFVTWCPSCGAETEAVTLEGDSLVPNVPCSLLSDLVAAGTLHVWSTEGGQAHICLASLHRCFEAVNDHTSSPQIRFFKPGDRQ